MSLADSPQVNKQHAVPQNIMDVEFKLIGDLTMRQFAYIAVCGGLSYFASVSVVGVFKWPVVVFFILLGLGLAFVPIQERGLDEWIANFIRAIFTPTQRVWRKAPQIPSAFMYESLAVVRQELITLAPTSSRRKLEEYLQYQGSEKKADPLDIPEEEYIMKVRAVFGTPVSTTAGVSVSVEEPSLQVPVEAAMVTEQVPEIAEVPQSLPQSEVTVSSGSAQEAVPTPASSVSPSTSPNVTTSEQSTVEQPRPTPAIMPKKKSVTPHQASQIIKHKLKPKSQRVPLATMTPDQHAGRRFTNLLPYGGELILPIRGEKVLHTSEEMEIEEDIDEKAKKLQQLLSQIKKTDSVKSSFSKELTGSKEKPQEPASIINEAPVEKKSEVATAEAQEFVEKLEEQNKELEKKIENLKQSGQTHDQDKDLLLKKLQTERDRTSNESETLKRQLLDLQNKLKEKESVGGTNMNADTSVKPVYAKINPITTKPNIISGLVRKQDGTVLEGVLMIIKNNRGEAVRAFKSNTIGQFSLTTPLSNGLYTLEVSLRDDKSLSFDIISIEAKGEVIPPIEIVGKQQQ